MDVVDVFWHARGVSYGADRAVWDGYEGGVGDGSVVCVCVCVSVSVCECFVFVSFRGVVVDGV